MTKDVRSRNWTFTLNNYTEESEQKLKDLVCKYLVYGREVGESGTPHLQGFVCYKDCKTFTSVKKKLPAGCHIEAALGNSQQNFDYCTKDKDFFEKGERPKTQKEKGQMNADRFKLAFEAAKQGDMDAIPEDIRIRYYRTFKQIRIDYMKPMENAEGTTGIWYYGKSGIGKSHTAREQFPNAYMKLCNKWWDGYQYQENVIIDDLDTQHKVLSHHLKIWADKYPFIAETKGGAMMIRPKYVVVTSQYHPTQLWEDPDVLDAIHRRFDIRHLYAQD